MRSESRVNRILVVDDQPKNIQVLASTLNDEGYEVEYATNGMDALEILENVKISLILLDIMMPGLNGFEVCKRIRENPSKKGIPIIFITAKTDVDSITTGFEVGGVDYVTKPFNQKELLARVKTHLELKNHKDNLEELVAQKTEELAKAYQELEVLDTAKSDFLKMISHEIRTPLNGVIGFIQLIKMNAQTKEFPKYIELIDKSASRLEEFSLKALLVTELRTKEKQTEKKVCQLNKVISSVLNKLSVELNDKGISVENTVSDQQHMLIEETLFEKAIAEIVQNVIRHSGMANKIIIKAEQKTSKTILEISDNGEGFSSSALDSIFSIFSFGKESADRTTGLGLHLVRLIGDIHDFKTEAGNLDTGGAFVRFIV